MIAAPRNLTIYDLNYYKDPDNFHRMHFVCFLQKLNLCSDSAFHTFLFKMPIK